MHTIPLDRRQKIVQARLKAENANLREENERLKEAAQAVLAADNFGGGRQWQEAMANLAAVIEAVEARKKCTQTV